ncbi:TIGR01777 family oxidoreductase [uncultured Pseudokineococcus sp.]|uniref:TIGR01777 family oxidoreductase n=1 Tax=uncultured Pseudokineococcus sp. TaxID=1642928 RepID=UPI002604A4FE|nr:TIGR01777 family oxidoreductase [uncultured Pseudokineococcus sp.]
MKVVIAGGSGALGRRLGDDLAERGHDVVVLSRTPDPRARPRQVGWDGATPGPWARELRGAAVVNLAGALVDRRPTPANVDLLTTSRVRPTRALATAAAALDEPVPVWVQASTAAIHGDAGDAVLTEDSPVADGPPQMAGVARAWEAAATDLPARRTVVLRTSVVLDRGTPALDRLLLLTRWGLGGRVGSGRQWFSWIHVEDWLAVVRTALEQPTLSGVVLATGPVPVRNAELMATLRAVVGRPPAPPTPAPLLRAGALLLRTDPALGLTGRRVVPARLQAAGFAFAHPTLRPALTDLLGGRSTAS